MGTKRGGLPVDSSHAERRAFEKGVAEGLRRAGVAEGLRRAGFHGAGRRSPPRSALVAGLAFAAVGWGYLLGQLIWGLP